MWPETIAPYGLFSNEGRPAARRSARRGRKGIRRVMPIHGKNIWRLCKTYGRMIGVPELKPHDLRHGAAVEMYGEHGDLEKVRALLGHQRIDTTQIYASIRPTQLKRSVEFLEAKASRMLNAEKKTTLRV